MASYVNLDSIQRPSTSADILTEWGDQVNDNLAYLYNNVDIGGSGNAWTSYATTWAAASSPPGISNGSLHSYYKQIGKLVVVKIFLSFGSTSSGGAGAWTFTLPFVSSSISEQDTFVTKCYVADGRNYMGFAFVGASSDVVTPFAPASASASNCLQVQNCNAASATGTGVPVVASNFSFVPGSNFSIWGAYETA